MAEEDTIKSLRDKEREISSRKPFSPPTSKGKTPKTRFNRYGEIVEPPKKGYRLLGTTDRGDRIYEKNGKNYIDFIDMSGVTCKLDAQLKSYRGRQVNDYMNYLSEKGKSSLSTLSDKDILFIEADLPYDEDIGPEKYAAGKLAEMKKDGKTKTVIFIDSKRTDAEKIAIACHELIHARGENREKEAMVETIQSLREMYREYPELLKDEKNWHKYFGDKDPDTIDEKYGKHGKLRQAVNYALASSRDNFFDVKLSDITKQLRRNPGELAQIPSRQTKKNKELEEIVSVLICIFTSIFLIFLFDSFHGTGFAVAFGNSINITTSFFLGVFIFLLIISLICVKIVRILENK